jgi:inositol hexakisphosphate/diphosphoinositol-pentakisphosphate kinase
VAQDICLPLFGKILIDLMFWKAKNEDSKYWHYKDEEEMTAERAIRTRLYFTSASHIYSLINLLTLANNRYLLSKTPEKEARDALNVLYLGYLSHI